MIKTLLAYIRQPQLQETFEPLPIKKVRRGKPESLLKPSSTKSIERKILDVLMEAHAPLSIKEIERRARIHNNDNGHRISGLRLTLGLMGVKLYGERRTGCTYFQYWLSSEGKRAIKARAGR